MAGLWTTLDRTSVRLLRRHATRHSSPARRAQRCLSGTSNSSQIASHTRRTGRPASIASTALRPPSEEKTWSRATLSARMEPNCSRSRHQKSCSRTPPTLARTRWVRLQPSGSYAGEVIGTGSDGLDLVLEIGIALALLVSLVLLWRNYRGR